MPPPIFFIIILLAVSLPVYSDIVPAWSNLTACQQQCIAENRGMFDGMNHCGGNPPCICSAGFANIGKTCVARCGDEKTEQEEKLVGYVDGYCSGTLGNATSSSVPSETASSTVASSAEVSSTTVAATSSSSATKNGPKWLGQMRRMARGVPLCVPRDCVHFGSEDGQSQKNEKGKNKNA